MNPSDSLISVGLERDAWRSHKDRLREATIEVVFTEIYFIPHEMYSVQAF